MALKVYRALANQRCIRELTVKDVEFTVGDFIGLSS